MPDKPSKLALRLAVLYIFFAGVWILLSDKLVATLIPDAHHITHFQTFKGMTFVIVTGGLLFVGLLHPLRRRDREAAMRMRAEESLQASEERSRALLATIPDMLFVMDADGRFLEYHGPREHLLVPPEQFCGKHAGEVLPPELAGPTLDRIKTVLASGEDATFSCDLKIGGELRHFESRFAPCGANTVVILSRDRTDSTRAETALRESEEHYRSLFENMLNGFACCRMHFDEAAQPEDFTYLAVNKAFENLTGLQGVVGKKMSEVVPGIRQTDPDLLEFFGRAARTGEPARRDIHVKGLKMWLSISAYRPADGHFVAVFDVITERKRAEEQLRKLSHAVEQSPVSIVITDTAGNIEYVNPKFTGVTGYTLDEVLGKNPRVLKSGEKASDEYKQLWQTITQGHEWHGEFHNKKKNGELYWEFASISPITDEAGRVTHFVAVKEDITGRKNLEAQLRHAQKMEAIGQLAGGVAHDFNNILAVIQMQTDLLRMAGDLKPEQTASAVEIEQAAERAASLTRQLLLFGRRQLMQARDIDLNDIVSNISKMLHRLLGEDIRIHLNYSPRHLLIHADAGMIDQVLLNLAINSRDAMPNGGRLVVETSRIDLSERQTALIPNAKPGSYACLTVMDNGTGIKPEDLPHIFEPFFTTKDVGKGSGLGLATVFGIVEQHRGWIDVISTPGIGTTFRIHLPLLASHAPPKARHPALTASRGGTETILVAEDDSSLRILIRFVLTRLGYRMIEAPTGIDALHVWQENRDTIQLLLTDLVMPDGMSGIELAQRIKEDAPQMKVIYMSGYSPEIAAKNVSLHEGVDFLAKPFHAHELAEIIREALDRKPA